MEGGAELADARGLNDRNERAVQVEVIFSGYPPVRLLFRSLFDLTDFSRIGICRLASYIIHRYY